MEEYVGFGEGEAVGVAWVGGGERRDGVCADFGVSIVASRQET